MKITKKGQVTIPQDIRERCGLLPGTEVEIEAVGGEVLIRKARSRGHRGEAIVNHLRGRARTRLSTDEIMALTRND